MRHFCTYFDLNYLPRGLALYASLRRHCPDFTLWIMAMDSHCQRVLEGLELPQVRVFSLAELEAAEPGLAQAKKDRSRIEYYFTCTPCLPRQVLRLAPQAQMVTYLDADLYFFSDPEPLFVEMGQAAVAITAHRFPPPLEHLSEYGRYNVAWLSFRRGGQSEECLRTWRDQCTNWCFDRLEDGRFADQKYLDDWPEKFSGCKVLSHPGANLAPWNLANHALSLVDGKVLADGRPLVFYHFHGLRVLRPWLFDAGASGWGGRASGVVRSHIYAPYLKALAGLTPESGLGSSRAGHVAGGERLRALLRPLRGVFKRDYLILMGNRII